VDVFPVYCHVIAQYPCVATGKSSVERMYFKTIRYYYY
jgi:hypothetical protein